MNSTPPGGAATPRGVRAWERANRRAEGRGAQEPRSTAAAERAEDKGAGAAATDGGRWQPTDGHCLARGRQAADERSSAHRKRGRAPARSGLYDCTGYEGARPGRARNERGPRAGGWGRRADGEKRTQDAREQRPGDRAARGAARAADRRQESGRSGATTPENTQRTPRARTRATEAAATDGRRASGAACTATQRT